MICSSEMQNFDCKVVFQKMAGVYSLGIQRFLAGDVFTLLGYAKFTKTVRLIQASFFHIRIAK
jgi:hypothetical protein